jgi:hypothetical protein
MIFKGNKSKVEVVKASKDETLNFLNFEKITKSLK